MVLGGGIVSTMELILNHNGYKSHQMVKMLGIILMNWDIWIQDG